MSSAVGATKSMITWPLVAMILVSVSCSAFAQISLKRAMSVRSVHSAIIKWEPVEIALAVAASPMLWLGLMLYGFSTMMWLFVLASLDVSVAYAFVAIGFLLTMSLGCLLLGEPLTLPKVVGTGMVMFGIWLVTAMR
jgi:multidrug transporter EmrE-like cation transporter